MRPHALKHMSNQYQNDAIDVRDVFFQQKLKVLKTKLHKQSFR